MSALPPPIAWHWTDECGLFPGLFCSLVFEPEEVQIEFIQQSLLDGEGDFSLEQDAASAQEAKALSEFQKLQAQSPSSLALPPP